MDSSWWIPRLERPVSTLITPTADWLRMLSYLAFWKQSSLEGVTPSGCVHKPVCMLPGKEAAQQFSATLACRCAVGIWRCYIRRLAGGCGRLSHNPLQRSPVPWQGGAPCPSPGKQCDRLSTFWSCRDMNKGFKPLSCGARHRNSCAKPRRKRRLGGFAVTHLASEPRPCEEFHISVFAHGCAAALDRSMKMLGEGETLGLSLGREDTHIPPTSHLRQPHCWGSLAGHMRQSNEPTAQHPLRNSIVPFPHTVYWLHGISAGRTESITGNAPAAPTLSDGPRNAQLSDFLPPRALVRTSPQSLPPASSVTIRHISAPTSSALG